MQLRKGVPTQYVRSHYTVCTPEYKTVCALRITQHETDWTDTFFYAKSQARKQGGDVLVVHGNHEIMNVLGDFRYATKGAYGECARYAESKRRKQIEKLGEGTALRISQIRQHTVCPYSSCEGTSYFCPDCSDRLR